MQGTAIQSSSVHITPTLMQAFPDLGLLVLVGDHKQLPATVMSEAAKAKGYQLSLFERLQV